MNLLYLLGYSGQGQLRIFGPSNEMYHVAGGNDQIPNLMAQELEGQITAGSELIAVKRNSNGTYSLSFNRPQARRPSPPTRWCSRCRSPSCAPR